MGLSKPSVTPPIIREQAEIQPNLSDKVFKQAEQSDARQSRIQAETKAREAENPDAILESAENALLTDWAGKHFPDLEPTEFVVAALSAIQKGEIEAGFAEFDVTQESPYDLLEEVELSVLEQSKTQRVAQKDKEIEDGVPAKVPAEAGEQSRLVSRNVVLETASQSLAAESTELPPAIETETTTKAANIERNETAQVELEALQVEFLALKSEIGTEAALRQILNKATIPEAQQHIRAVLGTVSLLRSALPNKDAALTRLLNAAPINLGAVSVAASFASVLSAAETSPDFTSADVATMRQIIDTQEIYVRTGTQVQTELGQTQTDENGQTVPSHPEDDPLKFRLNVVGFTEPDGTQKLRAMTVHGERVTLDITGWSGADIGRASELLQLCAMTENEGQTDYLTSLTKLKWTGTTTIDPFQLQHAAQVVSAILGGSEGHDGDIFDGKDALGMIRWQAQLANQKGGTVRGNRDVDRTNDALVDLGIRDKDGNLNLDALKAFGEYSRDNWNTPPDFDAVQAHLKD
jgi:hypothetical protein